MTLHEVLIGDVSVSVDSVSDGNDALAIKRGEIARTADGITVRVVTA